MTQGIHGRLRELLEKQTEAEAVETLLSELSPADLADFARPYLKVIASGAARKITVQAEKAFFYAGSPQEQQAAGERLRVTTFKHEDGSTVSWGQATAKDFEMRIAWEMGRVRAHQENIAKYEAALKLLSQYQAEKLDDIPNWTEMLNFDGFASG